MNSDSVKHQDNGDRKKWLNDYFNGEIAHTFDTMEEVKKLRESGIITYVHDELAHCGYYVLSKEE